MCGSTSLVPTLDLGHSPPADGFLTAEALQQPETQYPLKLLLCTACGLSQLSYVVSPEILFSDDYPYESSTSKYFRDHFAGMATDISSRFEFDSNDMAVDIGSNVGVLLGGFQTAGLKVVGVEPVPHLATKANDAGVATLNSFWDTNTASQIVSDHGKASVITTTNVFAHVDDLDEFVTNLKVILLTDGVFVIEAPYFVELVNKMEYDTIYHEHLSYILMSPLVKFFAKHGLEVFDVEQVPMHGLSLRVFVGFQGQHPVSGRVDDLVQLEANEGVLNEAHLIDFSSQVVAHKKQLVDCLYELKSGGKTIAAISAPAKGNTLLNYCGLNTDYIDFMTERAEAKIGLFAPGTHIPVVHDDMLDENPPDYGLLLAWNLRDEIIRNLKSFSGNGGKFIVPMPELEII
jgi:hypothetical protein